MNKIVAFLVLGLMIGVMTGFAEISTQEISKDQANLLIESRIFYAKDIGFSVKNESGEFTNEINRVEPGTAYITRNGVLHVGNKAYLIPWQKIKFIGLDKMAGSSSAILIRTTIPVEKLQLLDPKQVGNLNTLDTSMDTLLRQLTKTFKEYEKNPGQFAVALPTKPLKGTLVDPRNMPPEPAIKSDSPKTKEIKAGMTFTEVENIMGAPLKKIVLDDKVIYQYSDMILTFKDGKMTDAVVK